MAPKLTPNPSAVRKARQARQLTVESLAVEANVALDIVAQIEEAPTEVSKRTVFSIADALSVPPQLLFSSKLQIEENIPDFRTAGNKPAVLTSSGVAKIDRARSIISYLDSGVIDQRPRFRNIGVLEIGDVQRGVKLVSSLYIASTGSNGFIDPTITFRETRVAIERSGIIVLCDRTQDAFRGFCFAQKDHYPIIFVNTSQQRPATKLFTLMHELVHVFVGQTGVSDPAILNNKLERFCNKVAAAVMMPEGEFTKHFNAVAKLQPRAIANALARRFGASKQAVALRINELNLRPDFYSAWLSSLPSKIPPIEEEDEDEAQSGGGGIGAQISRFGYLLPNVLTNAVKHHRISQYDAYRLTKLKPGTISKIAEIGTHRLG